MYNIQRNFSERSSLRGLVRFLSDSSSSRTAAHKTTKSKGATDFVKDRLKYNEEMAELRKGWKTAYDIDKAEKDRLAKEEKKRSVLRQAMQLREKRRLAALRAIEVAKEKAYFAQRYRERLASTHILYEEKQARLKERKEAAVKALEEEAPYWITRDNVNERITPALFSTTNPATTGFVAPWSQHWQYQTFVPSLKRLLSADFRDEMAQMTVKDVQTQLLGEQRVDERLMAEDFLERMIGTAEERSEMKELLKETMVMVKEGLKEDEEGDDDDDDDDDEDGGYGRRRGGGDYGEEEGEREERDRNEEDEVDEDENL